MIEKDQFQKWG